MLASCGSDGTVRLWNPANGQPAGTILAHAGPATGVAYNPGGNVVYSTGEDGTLKFWQLPLAPARALPPHGDLVTAVTLSPDGNQVLSASADKTVRVAAFGDGKLVRTLTGPTAAVQALALTPALVAGGTADNRLFLWNAADGKLISQYQAHAGPVNALAFHPQNNQLLTGGGDGLLRLWTMPPIPGRTLAHADAVLAGAVAGDGKRLITGSADKIVRSWNLSNNQVERQYPGHTGTVTAVAITANGQVLASASADQTIRFWDQNTGKERALLGAHAGPVTALSLNQAGTQVLSASMDGTVKLWQVPTAPAKAFTHPEAVTSVVLSPDGTKLLTGCTDKQARLWNLTNGQMERAFPGNTLAVTSVAFSTNGTLAAGGGADKTVTIWNVADAKVVKKLTLPAAVTSVAFPPAANAPPAQVAAGLADNSVQLLDIAKGTAVKTFSGHTGAVSAVDFLPKGDQLISASADGTVRVWNIADGMAKTKLEYGSAVHGIALTKDAARLAAGGAGKTVKVWNLADGKETASIATSAEVRSIAWSADGTRLLVGGADNHCRLYESDGKLVEFFPHDGPVLAVALHPDGKQIISAGADKTVRIWTSSLVRQVAHAGAVRQAFFTPKGDQFISAGDDRTVRIWNIADGKLVKSIPAHQGPVVGCILSPDGTKIISAGADNHVKVWLLTPPKPGAAAEEKPAADLTLAGAPHSLTISPNGARLAVGYTDKAASSIRVLDLATGKDLMNLAEHAGPVRVLAFQPDNRTLVSAGDDKMARISDIAVQSVWDAHAGGVTAVAYHSNGTQAVSGGVDRTVKLWNLPGAKEAVVARTFGPLADPVTAVAFSRDYTQLGAAAGKVVKVWSATDGKEVLTLTHPVQVKSLSFSVDKTKLVTGAADNLARVWDAASGKVLQAFDHGGPVESVVFHPNNTTIIAGSADKTVGIHALSAVRVIAAAGGPVRGLALTPNGSHVLTTDEKEVRLWNTSNGAKEARTFAGAEGALTAIAVSKNNVLVATGGADQTVRVYQFADGKPLAQFKVNGPIQRLAFSPNNQTLAAGCADKSVLNWNILYTQGQPPPLDFGKSGAGFGHDAGVTDIVFNLDSTRLYSGSLDKKVRTWKFASDVPTKSLAHPNLVDAVAFNPAGTQLATGCHDGTVRLWDVAKGQQLRQINAHTMPAVAPVYCVVWTADGKQVLSTSLDRSMKLWDATSGNLVREFKAYKEKDFEKGHKDGVFCAAFSPDGKLLASGGSDHTIKIWNVADGTVLRECINPKLTMPAGPLPPTPQAHPGWVYTLRFTSDGKHLISGGNAVKNQGYLAVWTVADGKLLSGEELPVGAIYSLAISPDGKYLALACGPRGRQLMDTNGFILKIPEVVK
jgi:WD40 repeat protein